MRALIFSDTHGDLQPCLRAVNTMGTPDLIVHLGDFSGDARRLAALFPDARLESVIGNCDFGAGPSEKVISFDGHSIYITHGHLFGVAGGLKKLARRAGELGCEMACFGHTHRPFRGREGEIAVLNPGSISFPRGAGASFAVLESEDGRIGSAVVDWL